MMFLQMLYFMICGHALADFALQSDAMARGKNRNRQNEVAPPPGVQFQPTWYYWLTGHALIHGLMVSFATGIWWLGCFEAIAHWLIDFGKCDKKYGVNTDQAFHFACKILWAFIAIIFHGVR